MHVNEQKDRLIAEASSEHRRRFWAQVEKSESCWLFLGVPSAQYGIFRLSGKNMIAHRVAKLWRLGLTSSPLFALHRCANKRCVRPAHIYLGTTSQNVKDAHRDGALSSLRGENSNFAKTDEATVKKIWEMYHSTDMSASKVAKANNVPLPLVHVIVDGKTWTHVIHKISKLPKKAMWEKRAHGEEAPKAKIRAKDLTWICADLNAKRSVSSIAKQAGVSSPCIHRIAEGKGWIKTIRDMGIYLKVRKPNKRKPRASEFSDSVRNQAISLRSQGLAYAQIAKRLKVSNRIAHALSNRLTTCDW